MLRLLLYFPSATFSIIQAEIFPYGVIYALTHSRSLSKNVIPIIFVMLLSCIWGAYNYQIFTVEVFRSIAAYLNAVLVFLLISNYHTEYLNKLIKLNSMIFYLLIFVGVLQFTGIFSLVGMGYAIELIMSRGSDGIIGHGRGISLLASEPSRASYEFLFIYMLFRTTLDQSYQKIFYDCAVSIFILFFIKSATGALFLVIYMAVSYRKYIMPLLVLLVTVLFFVGINISLMTDSADTSGYNSRALELMMQSFSALQDGTLWDLFITASGFRGISVYAAYLSGWSHLFGFGIGMWEQSSVTALYESGYNPSDILYFANRDGVFTSIRPTSFIASTMLDMGLIGTLVFLYSIRRFFILHQVDEFRGAFYCFVFYIFFVGSIGNPIPWLIIGALVAKQKQLFLRGDVNE